LLVSDFMYDPLSDTPSSTYDYFFTK